MAIDPKNQDRIYELVKGAYDRLDSALYKIKDGDGYVAKDLLDRALNGLKEAYRML